MAVSPDGLALEALPLGLPPVTLRGATQGPSPPVDPAKLVVNVTALPYLALSLAAGAVAFSTADQPTVAGVRLTAAAAAAAERDQYARVGELAEAAQGVQAAIAWNTIYTPAEAGPFPPVSKGWNAADANSSDVEPDEWTYVIFCCE